MLVIVVFVKTLGLRHLFCTVEIRKLESFQPYVKGDRAYGDTVRSENLTFVLKQRHSQGFEGGWAQGYVRIEVLQWGPGQRPGGGESSGSQIYSRRSLQLTNAFSTQCT